MARGDLTDAASVRAALEGVEVVFHCAAKVGDWGPVEDYRAVNVEALRGLLEACRCNPCGVSSISAALAFTRPATTTAPTRPAVARAARGRLYAEQGGVRTAGVAVPARTGRSGDGVAARLHLRASDRTVLPNLIEKLRRREIRYIGNGRAAMNCIFVGNLVDAALLAMEKPEAAGQVYNVTDGETVSKRRFIEAVADGVGARGRRAWACRCGCADRGGVDGGRGAAVRGQGGAAADAGPAEVFGLNLDFSIEKAKGELGYRPRVPFEEGMRLTTDWYKRQA